MGDSEGNELVFLGQKIPGCLEEGMTPLLDICQRFFFFFSSFFFRVEPVAYEGSQARGRIRDVAAGLCQSHSNARSELCL